jgi:Protein of unknown function (DUF1176)
VFALAAVAVPSALAAGAGLPGTKTAKDRAAWRARVHWPAACEESWRSSGNPGIAGVSVWKLNAAVRLVEVSCSLGAYQGTEMLYFARTDDATRRPPISLLIYEDSGTGKPTAKRRTLILGTMAFSLRTRQLNVLDKFRGAGDCGISSTFALEDDVFVPITVRAKLACNGKPPFDPARWPKLPLPH